MKTLHIHLTNNKEATLEYPDEVTAEDIAIIIQSVNQISPYRKIASMRIERNGRAITLGGSTLAECEAKRAAKYPDWTVEHSYEI